MLLAIDPLFEGVGLAAGQVGSSDARDDPIDVGGDGAGGGAGRDGFAGSVAISIGPRTTARLRERGWDRVIEATSHDRRGIVTALVASVGKDS